MGSFLKCCVLALALGTTALPEAELSDAQLSSRTVRGSFITAKAPHENIFAGITNKERKDILSFLKHEKNHTVYV